MRLAPVFKTCGLILLTLAGTLILPLGVALLLGSQSEALGFVVTILVSLLGGLGLFFAFRRSEQDLGTREGFVIVAFGWLLLAAVGALPFILIDGGIPSYLDAFFETMSGFTTTGASILDDRLQIESLPPGLLFWRCMTHWLGGMGIVVLTVAVLPFLGAGGYQMLRAEVPGPTADKLQPRIAQTAKILWTVYLLLTVVEILLLLPKMNLYDATCHAFATLATGGFSTKNLSVDAFDSAYVDYVITAFMLIAGANFVLHYRMLVGKGIPHLFDTEFRLYALCIGIATLFITISLYSADFADKLLVPEKYDSISSCFRYAIFQVGAVTTTTGFVTADFDGWPNACRIVIALLMVIGGCAGSTGGGIKMVRVLVLVKYGFREIQRIIRPHAVIPVKVGGEPIDKETVSRVMGFLALYSIVFFASVFAMSLILSSESAARHSSGSGQITTEASEVRYEADNEALTAFGSVIATLGNIGPGFAGVGPTKNFAEIPASGKVLLIFCMLVGRLEIYSVLLIFFPQAWRR